MLILLFFLIIVFWGETYDSILGEFYDSFAISSLDRRLDRVLYNMHDYALVISEGVLLKYSLMSELEQKLYDVRQLLVSVEILQLGKVPYYPVVFNKHSKLYEVFNYFSFCWVPVKEVCVYSRLLLLFIEQEFKNMFAGAQPIVFSRRLFISFYPSFAVGFLRAFLNVECFFDILRFYCLCFFKYNQKFLDWLFLPVERAGLFYDDFFGSFVYYIPEFDVWLKNSFFFKDADISLEFEEFVDKEILQAFWFRLGITSISEVILNQFAYDPRKMHDCFYPRILEILPVREKVELPVSISTIFFARVEGQVDSGAWRDFYEEYTWLYKKPLLTRNLKSLRGIGSYEGLLLKLHYLRGAYLVKEQKGRL
jgi:hypothetical protein